MAYVYPGANDTYVPSLSSDLVVEFSLDPSKFPAVEYVDYRVTDKMRGYYVNMLNDGQNRVVSDTDNLWADASDRPFQNITDGFDFPTYECVRRSQGRKIGHLAIDQAGWDVVDQASRFEAMQLMTARVKRIHSTLTASANWSWGLSGGNSNYATATTAGGGTWAAADSTHAYIRTSLAYAINKIKLATNNVVQAGELVLVINPTVAKVVALSGEYLNFVAQNTASIPIWENQAQFITYGLPEKIFGLRLIVDGTTYNSAAPGVAAVNNFTLSDSYAVLMTKQKAVSPSAGGAFSTFSVFMYQDMYTEIFDDPKNRRVELSITENCDTSVNALVAPQSGFLIKIDS